MKRRKGLGLLFLAALLAAGPVFDVSAQTKKNLSKKTPRKAQAVEKVFQSGVNLYGRPGLIYTDSAETPAVSKGHVGIHADYESMTGGSAFRVPFGASYGIAQDLQLHASLDFLSVSPDVGEGASGLNALTFGGKYAFPASRPSVPSFAVGLDITTSPLSGDLGPSSTDIHPKGMITHTFPSGLVLMGEFGFVITGKKTIDTPFGELKVDVDDFIQLKGGVGIPFTPALSGIAELSINEYGDSGSALAFGVRGGRKTGFQAFLGIGLGDAAPDFTLGGGVDLNI